MMAIPGS